MGTGIIVCGLNGVGKSTLGKVLAERLGYHFIDSEDLFFPKLNFDYKYAFPRSHTEAEKLFYKETAENPNFIFSSVKWNDTSFQYAILMEVPKYIRIKRVENRTYLKFGNRIMLGGDLYDQEKRFLDYVKCRKESSVEEWIKSLTCPIIRIDGTMRIEENVESIIEQIQRIQV